MILSSYIKTHTSCIMSQCDINSKYTDKKRVQIYCRLRYLKQNKHTPVKMRPVKKEKYTYLYSIYLYYCPSKSLRFSFNNIFIPSYFIFQFTNSHYHCINMLVVKHKKLCKQIFKINLYSTPVNRYQLTIKHF